MIHFALSDIIIIILYFLAVLYVGFRAARKVSGSDDDFLLAGRSLTLPVFVMTLVSTWYGGILGVGEFSYRYGISNWVVQGVPYYIFAAIFAFFLAKKIRATNLYSIPDKLELAYDKKTAILGSLLTFILMTPAPYILMLGVLIQMIFGWSLIISMIVVAIVAISYLYWGGFQADVQTDILEFILMFTGFAVILPFSFLKFGGMEFLQTNLPPLHLEWSGGNSAQFIMVWFFIALWTLVDPAFHQRCYAAKDGATAQKGILVSIIFWLVFDFMTATAGLYARAALPNLPEPIMAYPMLAEAVLPPIAKGLFYVGMLATIMSTLNTLAFVSAQTLGRDIFGRLLIGNKHTSNIQHLTSNNATILIKVGLIVSFFLSVVIALLIPSVIKIWYTIGTVVIPGLLVPLIASYFDKFKIEVKYAFLSMLLGWSTSIGWLISGHLDGNAGNYAFGIEPMYPGLLVSVIFWISGRFNLLHNGSA
ncbi:MAG: sodium:solute symporter family protein [Ignavibacteriales bacterium]|nr:sodium:solute symporter family protein [Ignavibacteriales bacterium]